MYRSEYSPYKALHHLEALTNDRPISVCWLITSKCNQNCPDCFTTRKPDYYTGSDQELSVMIDVVDQLVGIGVKGFSISGGEPTLYEGFEPFARYLINAGVDIGLVTNGTQFANTDIVLLSNFQWIRVSVNGMSKHNYKLFCGVEAGNYWQELELYVPKIKECGCMVGSSFLLRQENISEMFRFASWSKEAGFDTCRFGYVIDTNGIISYTDYQQSYIKDQIIKSLELSDDTFYVYPFSERMNLNKRKQHSHCYASDLIVVISANLNMYRCGPLQNEPSGFIGSLKFGQLRDIWKHRGSQDLSSCPTCWADEKNKFMTYLVCENHLHRNFI